MLHIEILIRKSSAVNRYGSRSIAVEEISPLDHKGMDTAVEVGAFVAHGFARRVFVFTGTELAKVLDGFWDAVSVELEFHAPLGDAAYGDVEEDNRVGVG